MNKHRSSGFTIVETMVVLAVTGVMFLSVVLLINGKQQQAQFQSAVKDVQAQIRQIMTETTSGYNQLGTSTCSGASGEPVLSAGTSDTLGTNAGCVFLGKTLIFSNESDEFTVAPIVGLRRPVTTDFTGEFVQDLNSSKPLISTSQAAEVKTLQFGLAPVAMYYGDDVANKVGSISFLLTPGVKDAMANSTDAVTTSQNLNLVVLKNGSSLGNNLDAEKGALETAFRGGNSTNYDYITTSKDKVSISICFRSGSTNQSLLLTIGNGNTGLGFMQKIYSGGSCGLSL